MFSIAAFADVLVHHDLHVVLNPGTGSIQVTDRVRIPSALPRTMRFTLGAAFELLSPAVGIRQLDANPDSMFREYVVKLDQRPAELVLSYRGSIAEFATRLDQGMPLAVLDSQGAFFDNASGWYPLFGSGLVTFKLTAELPADWQLVSQGRRHTGAGDPTWEARTPQDDIYFLAGPYRRYARGHRGHELEVYLLRPDQATAERYLGVMGQYLDFYSALVAEYPYPKFAVVENQWQTGYGMPSFTLLGSRVLRLPFILHSSLPHEILHNWWGNGVFIDFSGGNWSEGLTAYLADHLIEEIRGSGHSYRRRALEKYANFAAQGRDFPLRQFKARHDDASQAVGYSKALMLFHMVRREMGDAAFIAGLKNFWEAFRFRRAGFAQFQAVLEQAAGSSLGALQGVWLDEAGAPELAIDAAVVQEREEGGFDLQVRFRQTQAGPAYPLTLPLAIRLEGESETQWRRIPMTEKAITVREIFDTRPLRIDVDAGFDLFRLLAPEERPPALSRLFGAKQQLLVLPAAASGEQQAAWHALAESWQRRYRNVKLTTDAKLKELPRDKAVWLLGWDNRWLIDAPERFASLEQSLSPQGLQIGEVEYSTDQSVVVVLDPNNTGNGLAFVGAETATQIAALAGKLPHYGRYGRLVFDHSSLVNRVKEDLPVLHSPLSRVLGDKDPGPPSPLAPALNELVGVELSFE